MIDKRIKFKKEPSCEHCGNLEPFDAVFDDDGCWWCICCVQNGGSEDYSPTKEDFKEIEIKETTLKLKYFNERCKELIKELEKLNGYKG